MNLIEAEAKVLLAGHGIAVPRGVLLEEQDALQGSHAKGAAIKGVAVKAQLLSGGRGKAGLIRLVHGIDKNADPAAVQTRGEAEVEADIDAAITSVRTALQARNLPAVVLVEDKLDIRAEYYISFLLNDRAQAPLMLFSIHGGMEVESMPAPTQWRVDPVRGLLPHELIDFFKSAGVADVLLGALSRLAAALYRVYVSEDLELLEINPLVVTSQGRLVAADAKIIIDDCALFRHPHRDFSVSRRLVLAGMTALEREADEKKFTFIDLPGNVALMSYGAGLGMMLVDLLGDAGLRAACFVDGSSASVGNNTAERLQVVFKRAEAPEVKAILFYQNLSTRDIKPRVEAVLQVLRDTPPPKPFYFGFVAAYLAERNMTAVEACALVAAEGYKTSQEPRELVEMIKRDLAVSEADAGVGLR